MRPSPGCRTGAESQANKAGRLGRLRCPSYDRENARTLGRRDVPFWRRVALGSRGAGHSSSDAGRGGFLCRPRGPASRLVGLDRSAPMLTIARGGAACGQTRPSRPGDSSPFSGAPTNSLDRQPRRHRHHCPSPRAHSAPSSRRMASCSRCRRIAISRRGARLGGAPGARAWRHVRARSRAGRAQLARVREPGAAARPRGRRVTSDADRVGAAGSRRRLTTFEQCYVERRGARSREHRFELTFRTRVGPADDEVGSTAPVSA